MELKKPLNKYFDHTILKPEATARDVLKLCNEAKEYDFYSVCVNSAYVELASKALEGSDVKIAAVVGFPLGACSDSVKGYETDFCCDYGASEVDMVLNVGAMKDKRYDYIRQEIADVVEIANGYGAKVKVILETCLLSDEEIVKACKLAVEAGAAFVKTSTGFSKAGATAHHVKLMKDTVGNKCQVKASGGIRDLKTVMEMIEAGADRIGASASVAIMEEYQKK